MSRISIDVNASWGLSRRQMEQKYPDDALHKAFWKKKHGLFADRCFWFRTRRVHGYDRFVSRWLRRLRLAPVVVRRLQRKKSGTGFCRRCKATIQTTSPVLFSGTSGSGRIEISRLWMSRNGPLTRHQIFHWLVSYASTTCRWIQSVTSNLSQKLARPLSNIYIYILRKKYVNAPKLQPCTNHLSEQNFEWQETKSTQWHEEVVGPVLRNCRATFLRNWATRGPRHNLEFSTCWES